MGLVQEWGKRKVMANRARFFRTRGIEPAEVVLPRQVHGARIAIVQKIPRRSSIAGADALAVVTEWNAFREPDFDRMKSLLRTPVIFDGRNVYSPEHMRTLGFTYYSIGR